MSSTYSTNLAIELIGTGDQAGSWGNTTNTNLGTLIEQAISGYVTQAVSTGTDTTITIPNGATGVARNMYIELTGTGGTNTNLIVPANKKLYFIFNNSTGAVTVKVSGQTGVSVPTGKKVVLTSNGTDIVNGLNYIADFGSNSATITQLTATSATITNLTLTSLVISNLSIASANITTLTSSSATITNLVNTSASITTLTNNPTFSAGTANGVLYLNGSKVATSGSALVFDGTNLGVGTASPAAKLDVLGGVSSASDWGNINITSRNAINATNRIYTGLLFKDSGASDAGAIGYAYDGTGYNIQFATVSTVGGALTSRITIDRSGNLGIGTTNPAAYGTVAVNGASAGVHVNATSGAASFKLYEGAGTGRGGITSLNGSDGLAFLQGTTEAMRLTSTSLYTASGINVGIGTASPAYKLHVVGGAAIANRTTSDTPGNVSLGVLSTSSSAQFGWRTDTSNNLHFDIYNGASWSAALTTSLAGNLGLGVTPSAWTTFNTFQLSRGSVTATTAEIDVSHNAYFDGSWKYIANGFATNHYQANGAYIWRTAPSGTAGNSITFTQAMTLDSDGDLGLGTTTPASGVRLHVDASGGGTIRVTRLASSATAYGQLENDGTDSTLTSTGALIFQTGSSPAPRARITSGGDLLVGTTANPQSAKLYVLGSSYNATAIRVASNGNVATSYLNDSGTEVGYVQANASSTAYSTSSDRRLKSNIAPADEAGSVIDAIQIVKHDWKVGGHTRYGMIAQDLHVVAPEAVSAGDDGEQIEKTWGVDYSKLVPMLVKEIQSLRARVTALESA